MTYGYFCAGCGADLSRNTGRNTWCDTCHAEKQEESRRILAILPERNGLTAECLDTWYGRQFRRLTPADCKDICLPEALPSDLWSKWQEAVRLARTIIKEVHK